MMEAKATQEKDSQENERKLSAKEKEVRELKKYGKKLSLQSIYQHDFIKSKKKMLRKERGRSQLSIPSPSVKEYVQFQSTYLQDYQSKNLQPQHFHPRDNILKKDPVPVITTYSSSYQSHTQIEPEKVPILLNQPIKQIEMPMSENPIPFNGKSIYRHNYLPHYQPKVALPIIHQQSKIKSRKNPVIFQTTSKKSYSTIEPKYSGRTSPILPKNNLTNLQNLPNSISTTYRNMFITCTKPKSTKYDLDEIGNINGRTRGRKNF